MWLLLTRRIASEPWLIEEFATNRDAQAMACVHLLRGRKFEIHGPVVMAEGVPLP